MYFGASFFVEPPVHRAWEGVAKVLTEFATRYSAHGSRGQGALADSDRFTRLRKLTPNAVEELVSGLANKSLNSVLLFAGPPRQESVCLTVAWEDLGYSIDLNAQADDEGWRSPVAYAKWMWGVLAAEYGYAVWGETFAEAESEITGVPIRNWRAPEDPEEVARLLAIQAKRRLFGRIARGDAWGSFLGPKLVCKLADSNLQELRDLAATVESGNDGLYVQLTDSPLTVHDPHYRELVGALAVALGPVLSE